MLACMRQGHRHQRGNREYRERVDCKLLCFHPHPPWLNYYQCRERTTGGMPYSSATHSKQHTAPRWSAIEEQYGRFLSEL
jgi:hypothetical protein